MLIGPLSVSHLREIFSSIKENYNASTSADSTEPPKAGHHERKVSTSFMVLVVLFMLLWVWNIAALLYYWNRLPTISILFAIIGIFSVGFAPFSLALIYSTVDMKVVREVIIITNSFSPDMIVK